MSDDPRKALELLESLAASYRQAADQLDEAVNALRELVEREEFTEQRHEALEAARPLLSPKALQTLTLPPSGIAVPARPKKMKDRLWMRRIGPGENYEE